MSWTRRLSFLAIIWVVAIALLLAGTELALRLTGDGWSRTLRLNLVRSRTYDFPVGHLYESTRPTVRYVRDRYGLRDDCESPAEIDILTIGGSTTDQRFLAQDETFQAVMEASLERLMGTSLCVSNAGVDGHSTHGHLRAFRDWFPLIPGLRPKLFVFSIGINDADFTREGPGDFENRVLGRASGLKELHVVQLLLWLRDVVKSELGARPAHAGHRRYRPLPSEFSQVALAPDTPERALRNAVAFRSRLRRLLADARARGGEAICVTQPHRMVRTVDGRRLGLRLGALTGAARGAYGGLDLDHALRLLYGVMREECGEHALVDVYAMRFGEGDFYDLVHTTPTGARKIGLAIASFIAQSELKDDLAQ
ncbi:MAG TPA: GDSL-type esterase/lipase family protein [Sphingomicrobium sp.]|nr:GDSL-type esterase/lipase family protein [Sphingomicrobium sp.]